MAKNNNLQDFLTDVANSIRTKTGTTDQINAQDFSSKIESIETGITPSGTIDITTNGIVDVTNYEKANVNVPSSGENTLKNLLDTTHSAYYLFNIYTGTSVDNLIQPNDTENVTNMGSMFEGCSNLTTIPSLDTSNVTSMGSMFSGCKKLTSIPSLDTSNVTSMYNMFYNCYKLTSIPLLNTSNVTNMSYMFEWCEKLTTIPLLDTSNVTNMSYMLSHCSELTTIPLLNTSNVTTMRNMLFQCSKLTTIPAFDVNNVTDMAYMFTADYNLKSILMTNIGANLDISVSTKFERSDLLVILNNLKTVTEAKTLTMGATNLAKLTEEDKAIATNKGWTLA